MRGVPTMMSAINFLSSEESYSFDVPASVDPEPDLYGIIGLKGGAREVIYEPRSRRRDPDDEPTLKRVSDGHRGGVRVSVYKSRGDFLQVVAFWRVADGYVMTVADDGGCGDDLTVDIQTIIDGSTISTSKLGLPVLKLRPPLYGGDVRDQFQRDTVLLHPANEASWPSIKVTREPVWAHEGSSSWSNGDSAEAHTTVSLGITVSATGPQKYERDLKRHAADIASSLTPIP
jgi:hypothetical protein